jgi:transposase
MIADSRPKPAPTAAARPDSLLVQAACRPVRLDDLRLHDGTQCREEIDQATVDYYAERIEAGDKFNAMEVYSDGESFWLVDGFHRWHAAKKAGLESFMCFIFPGTLEDARWQACAANRKNGLHRSNATKQISVRNALSLPRGAGLSDRQIADHVGVSHTMVANIRRDLESTGKVCQSTSRTGKDGRTINTANIGKNVKEDESSTKEEPSSSDTPSDAVSVTDDEITQEESEYQKTSEGDETQDDRGHGPLDRHCEYYDEDEPEEFDPNQPDDGDEVSADEADVIQQEPEKEQEANKTEAAATAQESTSQAFMLPVALCKLENAIVLQLENWPEVMLSEAAELLRRMARDIES